MTSITLRGETRDKNIYPETAQIYLFMLFSVSQSSFTVTEFKVWVCRIPYMCTTKRKCILAILLLFSKSCSTHAIGKMTYREQVTKCYDDCSSAMMTPPGYYSLMLIPSLFFPLQFSGEKLHCTERAVVTMWFAGPCLTCFSLAVGYPSSLISLCSFFHGSTWLLLPFLLSCPMSFCHQVLYPLGLLSSLV